jgi:molybdopterin converting factor small subunit
LQNKIKIKVKLLANYKDKLPPGSEGNQFAFVVEENTLPEMILDIFSLPPLPESVILVNGKSPDFTKPLQDSDEVCVFSAMAGGNK